jgi:hypothetical protein
MKESRKNLKTEKYIKEYEMPDYWDDPIKSSTDSNKEKDKSYDPGEHYGRLIPSPVKNRADTEKPSVDPAPNQRGCTGRKADTVIFDEIQEPYPTEENIRSYNIGASDYAKHKIQPWDIWEEYKLNPWDADIIKRVLRTKLEEGRSYEETRITEYEKIIHDAKERIRQLKSEGSH